MDKPDNVEAFEVENKRVKSQQCFLCDKKSINVQGVFGHLKRKHKKLLKICSLCRRTFFKRNHLQEHMKKHVTDKTNVIRCGLCSRAFFKLTSLKAHQADHEQNTDPKNGYYFRRIRPSNKKRTSLNKSNQIKKSNKTKQKNVTHLNFEADENDLKRVLQLYSCKFCDRVLADGDSLKKHMIHHETKKIKKYKYNCKYCHKGYKLPKVMFNHMRLKHRDEEPFICRQCDLKFNRHIKFSQHISSVHKNNGSVRIDKDSNVIYEEKKQSVELADDSVVLVIADSNENVAEMLIKTTQTEALDSVTETHQPTQKNVEKVTTKTLQTNNISKLLTIRKSNLQNKLKISRKNTKNSSKITEDKIDINECELSQSSNSRASILECIEVIDITDENTISISSKLSTTKNGNTKKRLQQHLNKRATNILSSMPKVSVVVQRLNLPRAKNLKIVKNIKVGQSFKVSSGTLATCSICHMQMVSMLLRHHMKLHTNKKGNPSHFPCHLCSLTFRTNMSLNIHIKEHFKNDKLLCVCGVHFASENLLAEHKEKCLTFKNVNKNLNFVATNKVNKINQYFDNFKNIVDPLDLSNLVSHEKPFILAEPPDPVDEAANIQVNTVATKVQKINNTLSVISSSNDKIIQNSISNDSPSHFTLKHDVVASKPAAPTIVMIKRITTEEAIANNKFVIKSTPLPSVTQSKLNSLVSQAVDDHAICPYSQVQEHSKKKPKKKYYQPVKRDYAAIIQNALSENYQVSQYVSRKSDSSVKKQRKYSRKPKVQAHQEIFI